MLDNLYLSPFAGKHVFLLDQLVLRVKKTPPEGTDFLCQIGDEINLFLYLFFVFPYFFVS